MRQGQTADESGAIGGSSLVLADPPVIQRIKGTLHTLMEFAKAGDSGIGKMAFLFDTIAEELVDELGDYDDATMRLFLAQIGQVISWIGHGDNEALPETLRPFADLVQPTTTVEPEPEPAPVEIKELSA